MRERALLLLALAFTGCRDRLALPRTEPAPSSSLPAPSPSLDDPPANDAYVPPPESCAPASRADPTQFPPCSTGSGIFGTWTVDDRGLPAYDYGLDENADPRASFFNTEKIDRRDHWAPFGNARVDAMFVNDGYVLVTTEDRGTAYWNAFDPDHGNYAGGFSFVDDGEATWATAFKWRPAGAATTRRFGMGYAEASTRFRKIEVKRRTYAPDGDFSAVIDDVAITNASTIPRTIRHYEYWDVARRPLTTDWIVSGIPFTTAPAMARESRDMENAMFVEQASWDAEARVLSIHRSLAAGTNAPDPDSPSAIYFYPPDPYLAILVGDASDVWVDQEAFFGGADPSAPDAVVNRRDGAGLANGTIGDATSALRQPKTFVIRSDLSLAPGETKTLRFAYGVTKPGETRAIDTSWRDPDNDLRVALEDALRDRLPFFVTDRDPVLHRELAWHAYVLEASVAYRDYWRSHVVPQGSAYLYLHGADGACRDLALFAIPLVYTDPALAREELLLHMGLQYASDRSFAYAFQGHGMLDDALGLHSHPSDLDVFFLFALAEYVGATGDDDFLDFPAPYWPREAVPNARVYDHVKDAIRHLFDDVGTGPHGLIRLLSGDWNDGIILQAKDRALAMDKGESVPNTQMAVAILPRVADLIEARDPALADEIRMRVDGFHTALASAWAGSFYGRAFFGDGVLQGKDAPQLEAQVWALVGDEVESPADRDALLASVETLLDDPSPTGAMLAPQGEVWPAISGLLTWGYAKNDDERAFAHLARNTMAAHAIAFPSIWYGIWSGPDGLASSFGDRPGEAWYSQVTPMTDFPVMNANQHAMPILAMLRVAGIEATGNGIAIAPHVPGRVFSLRTKVLDLDEDGAHLRGTYRPPGPGARVLRVSAPRGGVIVSASVAGESLDVGPNAASVDLAIPAGNARAVGFDVTTSP